MQKTQRHRFNPWVRKIPWRRKWQPSPVFLPGKSHGQRGLAGYSPWGRKELDTTEHIHTTLQAPCPSPRCPWTWDCSGGLWVRPHQHSPEAELLSLYHSSPPLKKKKKQRCAGWGPFYLSCYFIIFFLAWEVKPTLLEKDLPPGRLLKVTWNPSLTSCPE